MSPEGVSETEWFLPSFFFFPIHLGPPPCCTLEKASDTRTRFMLAPVITTHPSHDHQQKRFESLRKCELERTFYIERTRKVMEAHCTFRLLLFTFAFIHATLADDCQIVNGVVVGGQVSQAACAAQWAQTQAQSKSSFAKRADSVGDVSFDDSLQPSTFSDTVPASTEYASFGVTFDSTWSVLDENSEFGITGFSSRNYLAFSAPSDTVTMTFSNSPDFIEISCGSPFAGSFTMTCLDSGAGGTDSITASTVVAPLTVTGSGITSCTVTATMTVGACDNLLFSATPNFPAE